MRDDKRGDPGERSAKRLRRQGLGAHVDGGERVVQDEDTRARDDGACQCQALPLAPGEAVPFFADERVESVGEFEREPRLCHSKGFPQFIVAGLRAAEGDVVPDARREEERLLEGDGDVAPELVAADATDVGAVEEHFPVRRVVEAHGKLAEQALAAAGCPDKRERLTWSECQVDTLQHLVVVPRIREAESHAAELEDAGADGNGEGCCRVGYGRRGVQHLEDSCRGCGCVEGVREQEAEGSHGPREHEGRKEERRELTDRESSAGDGEHSQGK